MGSAATLRATLLAAALSGASVARAQDAPATRPLARLRYVVDPATGCPAEGAFRQAIAARLGQDPFADDAASTLRATITRARGALVGRIAALDGDGRDLGEREVTARTCDALVEAMAVTATLAFDQPALRRAAEPAPAPAPPPAPPAPSALAPAREMEQDPVVALARIEASLAEASAQARSTTRTTAITLGIGGSLLTATGLVSIFVDVGSSSEIIQAISIGGGAMGVAGLLALAFHSNPAEAELRALRVRRAREDADAAFAHTVTAWERAVALERTRRTRRGVALIAVGGALVVGGGVGIAVAADAEQVPLATVTSVAVGLLGVVLGVEGARSLTAPGPLEAGWEAHRRWSPLALRPVASWTPRGLSLGLAATF